MHWLNQSKFNIENESFICSIETTIDIKENMILNFKVKSNREYNFKYRKYKTIVKRIELNAIVDSAYDNETLECYVEVISIDWNTTFKGQERNE